MLDANQPTAPGQPTTDIVNSGIHRYSRNPMYLGLVLALFGLGLALNIMWCVHLTFPTLLAMHHFLVLPEERYLEEKFGDLYRTYMTQVNRWF